LEPSAAIANVTTSVAGGQTNKSTLANIPAECSMILPSSSAEALTPFIFQFPATNGRRCPIVMTIFAPIFSPSG
jgi:hypothetical protein